MSNCRYDLPPSNSCESEECTRRHDLGVDYIIYSKFPLVSKVRNRVADFYSQTQFEESKLLQMMLNKSDAITVDNSTDESLREVIRDQVFTNLKIINCIDLDNISNEDRIYLRETYILSEFLVL